MTNRFPRELREHAVRMVLDRPDEFAPQWAAICSVLDRLGPEPDAVRCWARCAERDDAARRHDLEREVLALRDANELLAAASIGLATGFGG
jgi:transposase